WSWPQDQERPSIPLLEIFTHPEDYYDTKQYTFPVALAEIETLHPRDLWTLAEFLFSISGVSCLNPFVFRKKSDIEQRISSRRRYEELVQSTGEEIVPCTNNALGLPITACSPLLLPMPIATNDATTNESLAVPKSLPTIADSLDNSPAPLSLNPTPIASSPVASVAPTPIASSPVASVAPTPIASSPVASAPPVITPSVDPMTATPLVSASSPVAPVAPVITTTVDPTTATPLVSAFSTVEPVIATSEASVDEPSAASHALSATPSVSDSTAPGSLTPAMASELLNSQTIVVNAMPVIPLTTTPLVSASSAITLPVASAIVPETSEPQPTRQSRRGAQNKKASDATAGSLNTAQTGTDEPRRSSRKRSAKHANPITDSVQQPTAKRPRQKKAIKWAHVVPQPNGQLAMVNSDGTIRGYIKEDSDGKEIVVDSNGKILERLPCPGS
ncbi:hypothetical protein EV360DRAFT_74865, partial [Lentinula raphanica]